MISTQHFAAEVGERIPSIRGRPRPLYALAALAAEKRLVALSDHVDEVVDEEEHARLAPHLAKLLEFQTVCIRLWELLLCCANRRVHHLLCRAKCGIT